MALAGKSGATLSQMVKIIKLIICPATTIGRLKMTLSEEIAPPAFEMIYQASVKILKKGSA